MAEAVFSVVFAGPLVTCQDAGRPGNMRFGVAASGPMDRLAFAAGNVALGNPPGQTGIEVSPGGLILHCEAGEVTLAVTGGDFAVEHGPQKLRSWSILTIRKGEKLAIRAGGAGSWAYLAFAGALQTGTWLQSQATHAPSGFGGGRVQSGQKLVVANAETRDDRLGDIPRPDFTAQGRITVVIGPQDRHFDPAAVETFLSASYTVSDAFDRMGMRLEGPELRLQAALSIPSEPVVRGAVQVAGDGAPTVLLADHQTTGGYPKIATVISSDTDRLAQFRPGDSLRFAAVDAARATALLRAYLQDKARYLHDIATPRGTFAQRLMRENLISGWTAG